MKIAFSYFNQKSAVLLLALCGALLIGACSKDDSSDSDNGGDEQLSFNSSFTKSNDQVETSATGTLNATFDPETMELSYSFDWKDLTSNAIEMHIHDAGPIIVPITGFPMETTGSMSAAATLTADQAADLKAGKLYVQIHSENFPAGEIIAPFTATSDSSGGADDGGGDGGDGGGGGGIPGY